ncbi:hypothetical protein TNCV_3021781 [Trichonephila clavipes]|nr:hypothetical protein TNCV_3021781 [Trichonephila clavipes]
MRESGYIRGVREEDCDFGGNEIAYGLARKGNLEDSTLGWLPYFFRNSYPGQTRYQFLLKAGPVPVFSAALLGTGCRRDETTVAKLCNGHT